ncbi:MAG: hypothetical protein AAFV93_17615 [Chloroflexota bacterium]
MVDSVKNNVTWRAIPIAGFIGSIVFLALIMILNPILNNVDSFFILRYFASIVQGSEALVDESVLTLIIGIATHIVLSIFFALVIAIVIHRWGLIVGIVGGSILGLAFYSINFYTMTVFFPWMAAIDTPLLIAGHVVFGAVTGGIYESLDNYDTDLIDQGEAS